MVPRSLTTRVAVLLGVLVLTAGLLAAVVGTIGIRTLLMRQLDGQLHDAAQRNVQLKTTNLDHDADDAESNSGLPPGTITGYVDGAGTVTKLVIAADLDGDHTPSAADRQALTRAKVGASVSTVHLPDLGNYQVVATRTKSGEEMITGLPRGGVDHINRELIVLEVVALLAAALAVGAVGALAVRRQMRPLRQVAQLAHDVAELPLADPEGRIPLRANPSSQPTEIADVSLAMNGMLSKIDTALAEREASEQRLRDFIADASHELRTPLAVARSHAQLLNDYTSGSDLPPQITHSLHRIEGETGRMSAIVADLLLLARLDRTTSRPTTSIDLTHLVLDTVDDARTAAPQHRWQVDVPPEPVTVVGEEEQLHRLVSNLVSNAWRHTPAGTHVTVSLHQSNGRTQFGVHDDGPGFPPGVADQAHVRFVRGTGRHAHLDSTGLGLAIAHAVAERYGGELRIDSVPGDTTVTVTLQTS